MLMRPCRGIPGLLPPLAFWREMHDGTYTLDDVLRLNQEMDKIIKAHKQPVK